MQALLLHCAGPDVQGIFMHLEDVGMTYKVAMDTLNNHFESKKNVVFKRHVFHQAIQGTNELSLNFVTRLCKLASTCEFANPNSKIRDQFTDKCLVEFLIDNGSSINIINQDKFKKLETLMSLTLERSFVKIYPFDCKTPLPILGKCVVEICSNYTNKRTFATFHVIDTAASCILGKSTSELLCVLTVLQPTRYDRISGLAIVGKGVHTPLF